MLGKIANPASASFINIQLELPAWSQCTWLKDYLNNYCTLSYDLLEPTASVVQPHQPHHLSYMGLRMDDLHAPTVASGPSTQATTNGTSKKQSLPELIAQKENLEAELSALGSVLESVCYSHVHASTIFASLTAPPSTAST